MKQLLFCSLVALAMATWVGCSGTESTTTPAPSEGGDASSTDTSAVEGEAGTSTVLVTLSVPNMT